MVVKPWPQPCVHWLVSLTTDLHLARLKYIKFGANLLIAQ